MGDDTEHIVGDLKQYNYFGKYFSSFSWLNTWASNPEEPLMGIYLNAMDMCLTPNLSLKLVFVVL